GRALLRQSGHGRIDHSRILAEPRQLTADAHGMFERTARETRSADLTQRQCLLPQRARAMELSTEREQRTPATDDPAEVRIDLFAPVGFVAEPPQRASREALPEREIRFSS